MLKNEQKIDEKIFFDDYLFDNEKFLKIIKKSKEFNNIINIIDTNMEYLGNELLYKNLEIISSYSKSTETGIVIVGVVFTIISTCFSLLAIITSIFLSEEETNKPFVLFSSIILIILIISIFRILKLKTDEKISFSYNYLIKCIELKLDNYNMVEYKERNFFLIKVKEISKNW